MRETILDEIRRLAGQSDNQPPGQKLFARETGIGSSQWRGKYWARWGDAVAEAGFTPNDINKRLDTEQVLGSYVAACRHLGKLPTYAELSLLRRTNRDVPHPNTVREHIGGNSEVLIALAERAASNADYADIAAMLPELPAASGTPAQRPTKAPEGWVYLLKSGSHYKIGRSDQLEARVKKITVALPEATSLVHAIRTDDPSGIEGYWHKRFADKRANGEWFSLTAMDIAAFVRRKFQ
jgi:Meiotically up-regulated gene 113